MGGSLRAAIFRLSKWALEYICLGKFGYLGAIPLKEMMVTRCLILLGMVSFFLNHKEINKLGEEYSSLIVE